MQSRRLRIAMPTLQVTSNASLSTRLLPDLDVRRSGVHPLWDSVARELMASSTISHHVQGARTRDAISCCYCCGSMPACGHRHASSSSGRAGSHREQGISRAAGRRMGAGRVAEPYAPIAVVVNAARGDPRGTAAASIGPAGLVSDAVAWERGSRVGLLSMGSAIVDEASKEDAT